MSEVRTKIIHNLELNLDETTMIEITVWKNKRGGVYEVTWEIINKNEI